jgi:hypothetical protein
LATRLGLVAQVATRHVVGDDGNTVLNVGQERLEPLVEDLVHGRVL